MQGRRETVPVHLEHQDDGSSAYQAYHGGADDAHDPFEHGTALDLVVEPDQQQYDDKGRQCDRQRSGERSDYAHQMPGSGGGHDIIAHVRGAVDAYWTGGHLRNGHDVGESALGQPGMLDHDFSLDEREHGISSSESEHPYQEERPEQLCEQCYHPLPSLALFSRYIVTARASTMSTSRM